MKYEKEPSSLVEGKTKGQLHKEIISGKYYDKKHDVAKKMKAGIHKVGDSPSRFVHKGRKGDIDLYETWKGGKQHITPTK